MDAPIIDMHGIVKRFPIGTGEELEVLHGIDLTVRKGEFVAIMGSATFFSALVRGTRLNVWNTNPIFRQRMRESCLSRSVPTSTPSSTWASARRSSKLMNRTSNGAPESASITPA